MSADTPEIVVNVETPPEPTPPLNEALQVAREIAKSDEILGELRGLYSTVRESLVKIDALESRLVGISSQLDGVSIAQGAVLAQAFTEPEVAEEIAEEVAEEIITTLETEVIPATASPAPETAAPEEKKTRKRGFF